MTCCKFTTGCYLNCDFENCKNWCQKLEGLKSKLWFFKSKQTPSAATISETDLKKKKKESNECKRGPRGKSIDTVAHSKVDFVFDSEAVLKKHNLWGKGCKLVTKKEADSKSKENCQGCKVLAKSETEAKTKENCQDPTIGSNQPVNIVNDLKDINLNEFCKCKHLNGAQPQDSSKKNKKKKSTDAHAKEVAPTLNILQEIQKKCEKMEGKKNNGKPCTQIFVAKLSESKKRDKKCISKSDDFPKEKYKEQSSDVEPEAESDSFSFSASESEEHDEKNKKHKSKEGNSKKKRCKQRSVPEITQEYDNYRQISMSALIDKVKEGTSFFLPTSAPSKRTSKSIQKPDSKCTKSITSSGKIKIHHTNCSKSKDAQKICSSNSVNSVDDKTDQKDDGTCSMKLRPSKRSDQLLGICRSVISDDQRTYVCGKLNDFKNNVTHYHQKLSRFVPKVCITYDRTNKTFIFKQGKACEEAINQMKMCKQEEETNEVIENED